VLACPHLQARAQAGSGSAKCTPGRRLARAAGAHARRPSPRRGYPQGKGLAWPRHAERSLGGATRRASARSSLGTFEASLAPPRGAQRPQRPLPSLGTATPCSCGYSHTATLHLILRETAVYTTTAEHSTLTAPSRSRRDICVIACFGYIAALGPLPISGYDADVIPPNTAVSPAHVRECLLSIFFLSFFRKAIDPLSCLWSNGGSWFVFPVAGRPRESKTWRKQRKLKWSRR
jgi:hypothetical protein